MPQVLLAKVLPKMHLLRLCFQQLRVCVVNRVPANTPLGATKKECTRDGEGTTRTTGRALAGSHLESLGDREKPQTPKPIAVGRIGRVCRMEGPSANFNQKVSKVWTP